MLLICTLLSITGFEHTSQCWLTIASPLLLKIYFQISGFPSGSDDKESACSAEDLGSIPGLGRSPGGGHGNPLQYSCLEKSMDKRAWLAAVHGVSQSQTQLRDYHFHLPWSDETRCHNLSFLNVDFQASFFTLLFHPHQETL